jgi:hypothetical protein
MAMLFDIVSVQKLDGACATAALRRCEAEAPSVVFFQAGIAQLAERRPRNAEAVCSIQTASTSSLRSMAGQRFGKAQTQDRNL